MKEELINQFNHTWKMFYTMVNDFNDDSWLKTGCSYITPARISYHIIGGVNYYIENDSTEKIKSGKNNDWNWEHAATEDLPTREDIIDFIRTYKKKTEDWIMALDLDEKNSKFEWTGKNKISVVFFLLRHMGYHIGELNLLLHISQNGIANDNWIKAFNNIDI